MSKTVNVKVNAAAAGGVQDTSGATSATMSATTAIRRRERSCSQDLEL